MFLSIFYRNLKVISSLDSLRHRVSLNINRNSSSSSIIIQNKNQTKKNELSKLLNKSLVNIQTSELPKNYVSVYEKYEIFWLRFLKKYNRIDSFFIYNQGTTPNLSAKITAYLDKECLHEMNIYILHVDIVGLVFESKSIKNKRRFLSYFNDIFQEWMKNNSDALKDRLNDDLRIRAFELAVRHDSEISMFYVLNNIYNFIENANMFETQMGNFMKYSTNNSFKFKIRSEF